MQDYIQNFPASEDIKIPRVEDPTNDRAAINRENAQKSCGPRTEEGKRISSLNAVKTALTGRTILLESDDVELYRQHVAGWFAELKPEGLQETTLVQAIADSHWRNDRIVNIEAALFARGRVVHCYENDSLYGDEVGSPRDIALLVDVQVNTIYERTLRNLHIQENRLRRQRERDMADLQTLQKNRREQKERENQPVAASCPQQNDGFVFSSGKSRPSSPSRRSRKGRKASGKSLKVPTSGGRKR